MSKHNAKSVRGVSLRHDTRGVALLACGFCPNSSQLQTAGDCSGNLIPPEPLQTLHTRLTCNLCLPAGKREGKRGVCVLTIRIMAEIGSVVEQQGGGGGGKHGLGWKRVVRGPRSSVAPQQ